MHYLCLALQLLLGCFVQPPCAKVSSFVLSTWGGGEGGDEERWETEPHVWLGPPPNIRHQNRVSRLSLYSWLRDRSLQGQLSPWGVQGR